MEKTKQPEIRIVNDENYEEFIPKYDLGLKEGETISQDELVELVRSGSYLEVKDMGKEWINEINPRLNSKQAQEILASTGVSPKYISKARELKNKRLETQLEKEHERYVEKKDSVLKTDDLNIKDLIKRSLLYVHAIPTAIRTGLEKPIREDTSSYSLMGALASLGYFLVIGNILSHEYNNPHLILIGTIPFATNTLSGIYELSKHLKKKIKKQGN